MSTRSHRSSPDSRRTTIENSKAILKVAGSHHGIVSRTGLLKAGLGAGLIDKRIRAMRLVPVYPGVYKLGSGALTLRARHMAAVLAGGPCAALSHRSAGAHWGLLRPPRRIEILRSSSPDRPNSKLTGGPDGRSDRLVIHRSRVFNEEEYEIHQGIRTTTVVRTLLNLASVLNYRQLESAYTEAERLHLIKGDEMRRALRRGRGWKGIHMLRHIVETWSPEVKTTKSDMEIAFARLCQDENIEMPELNVRIGNMEIDCLWREQKLVVELDTPRFHADPAAFYRDRMKDRKLDDLGLRVLRLTDRMIFDEPAATANAVRTRLERARSP